MKRIKNSFLITVLSFTGGVGLGPELLRAQGPSITNITPILDQQSQTITITGSGFGNLGPYTGDSRYIKITDNKSPLWAAGNINDNPPDYVTLSISSWTDTQIVISEFSGAYGNYNWTLQNGDPLIIDIWNAETDAGPASCSATVGAAKTGCSSGGTPSPTSCKAEPSASVPTALFSPQPQQQGDWCWAAVSRILAINAANGSESPQSYQCNIVNTVLGKGDDPANPEVPYCCSYPNSCNVGGRVNEGLGALGYRASVTGPGIGFGIGGLSREEIMNEISCKKRVVGFQLRLDANPSSQHAMVIYGYEMVSGDLMLSIYDPQGKVPSPVSYDSLLAGVVSGYSFHTFFYDVRKIH